MVTSPNQKCDLWKTIHIRYVPFIVEYTKSEFKGRDLNYFQETCAWWSRISIWVIKYFPKFERLPVLECIDWHLFIPFLFETSFLPYMWYKLIANNVLQSSNYLIVQPSIMFCSTCALRKMYLAVCVSPGLPTKKDSVNHSVLWIYNVLMHCLILFGEVMCTDMWWPCTPGCILVSDNRPLSFPLCIKYVGIWNGTIENNWHLNIMEELI